MAANQHAGEEDPNAPNNQTPAPDFTEPVIGTTEGGTRWLLAMRRTPVDKPVDSLWKTG